MVTEPVGLSNNLPIKRVMPARVGDTDIAVWRSASGVVSAWLNRCPHRGMRLSHGFVRGESLACLYHGWQYGCDNKCKYIPAHPALEPPTTIQTMAYTVVEKHGVLWVSLDGTPEIPALFEKLQPVRSISFNCSNEDVLSALAETTLTCDDGQVLSASDMQSQNILILDNPQNKPKLAVLFQKSSAANVTAHLLADNSWSIDGLIRISRWCELVRRRAEIKIPDNRRNL